MPMSSLPKPLQVVLGKALAHFNRLMSTYEAGLIDVTEWKKRFKELMEAYHFEALNSGLGNDPTPPQAQQYVTQVVTGQLPYLNKWALEIQSDDEFQAGWRQRAALYAMAIKQDYWTGVTKFLPLPAMPGDGTSQCLGNCTCHWDILWLDDSGQNADATWVLGAGDHCQTCAVRASDWKPIRIRDGILLENYVTTEAHDLFTELWAWQFIEKAWPKGRHLSAAHKAKIAAALRKHHGVSGGSSGSSSKSDELLPIQSLEDRNAGKRMRAQRRREAAKNGTATTAKVEAPKAKPAEVTKPQTTDPDAAKREAKRLRAQKRREAEKAQTITAESTEPKQAKVDGGSPAKSGRLIHKPEPEIFPDDFPDSQSYLRASSARYDREETNKLRVNNVNAGRDFAESGKDNIKHVFSITKGETGSLGVQEDLRLYGTIPNHIRNQLAGSGMVLYDSTTLPMTELDTNQLLRGVKPRGWPEGKTWDIVAGSYSPRKNQVVVSHKLGNLGGSTSDSVMMHEVGHAVGYQLGYDTHPKFAAAYQKALATKSLNPYLRQPGAAGQEEFFAEVFSTTMVNEVNARLLYGDEAVNFIKDEIVSTKNS